MQHLKTKIDTSKELVIHKHGNGIKLLRPSTTRNAEYQNTVGKLLQMPFNVYFLNADSKIQTINDISAVTSGFDSSQDALGKSMLDVLEASSANAIIKTDREILENKTININEVDMEIKEDVVNTCLCIRLPWFNNEDKIIGIMGMAIVYSTQDIGPCLTQILNTGLLNSLSLPLLSSNYYGLTKRQMECLYYITKGKTVKQAATTLGLSPKTVEHYIEATKSKLGCSTRSELIDAALSLREIRERL